MNTKDKSDNAKHETYLSTVKIKVCKVRSDDGDICRSKRCRAHDVCGFTVIGNNLSVDS
jgi:hypothetical protein